MRSPTVGKLDMKYLIDKIHIMAKFKSPEMILLCLVWPI